MGLVYLGATSVITVLIWPFLWRSPLTNFAFVFTSLKKFFWDTDTLFFGEVVRSVDLPWTYVPGWILVTVPIVYLIFFLAGFGKITANLISRFIKSPTKIYKYKTDKYDLVVWGWLIAPLLAVIAFNSTMYDGWRHMFFIYPAMVYFGVHGLKWVREMIGKRTGNRTTQIAFSILMVVVFAIPLTRMVADHPYQMVYFNELAGRGNTLDKRFEQEYWALSCYEILDKLVELEPQGEIKVFTPELSGKNSLPLLEPTDRSRIRYVEFQEADYFIYHHRFERAKQQFYEKVYPFDNEIHAVEVNGVLIAGLYSMKNR